VTALELLAALPDVTEKTFPNLRKRVDLAYELSDGRVLEDPKFLICTELLRIPFPPDFVPPSAELLSKYMDVIRHARSRKEILDHRVRWKGGLAGMDSTSPLREVVASVKREWIKRTEDIADDIYPEWRRRFKTKRRRLPLELRKEHGEKSRWDAQKSLFGESLLTWLGATSDLELLANMTTRLDAVLEYTISVVRLFLTSPYSLDERASDVFDQFQLLPRHRQIRHREPRFRYVEQDG